MKRFKPAQERNPFSDTASMVLRAALSNPSKTWGIRELARMSGASPALTALVLKRLEHLGHVSRETAGQPNLQGKFQTRTSPRPAKAGQVRILDPVRLLQEWAAWYSIKPLRSFRYSVADKFDTRHVMALLRKFLPGLPGQWALTSMAGASLVAPHADFKEVHIQLSKAETLRLSWEKVLHLTFDNLGAIHLIEPYYAESGSQGIKNIRELPVVTDIQLYLDCYRYPVRGREQAEHILHHVLVKRWEHARRTFS